MRGWVMTTLLPLAVTVPCGSAHAQVTQPFPNLIPCNSNTVKLAQAAGKVQAIPGQPGEMGFVSGSAIPDIGGNTIGVYCLLPNAKHGGPDQAALYTPAGKPGVWVGACTLTTGQNVFTIMADKIVPAANGQSFLNLFTGFTWKNYENITPADMKALAAGGAGTKTAATYNNYEYNYSVKTNQLTVTKTVSYYQQVNVPGGGTADTLQLKTATVDPNGPYAAPTTFQGLTFNKMQIAAVGTSGDPGLARQSLALASLPAPAAGGQAFALQSDALYGSGTAVDPFVGLSVPITAGDTLTIGEGAASATVTGSAASPSHGGWMLASMNSYSTTFDATSNALLLPGDLINAFDIVPLSSEPQIPWIYHGSDPLADSAGYVIPEPGTFRVLAVALGLLAGLRRRRAFFMSAPGKGNTRQWLHKVGFAPAFAAKDGIEQGGGG
jgi:hypothetical protein